jgi:hypothetical protein
LQQTWNRFVYIIYIYIYIYIYIVDMNAADLEPLRVLRPGDDDDPSGGDGRLEIIYIFIYIHLNIVAWTFCVYTYRYIHGRLKKCG